MLRRTKPKIALCALFICGVSLGADGLVPEDHTFFSHRIGEYQTLFGIMMPTEPDNVLARAIVTPSFAASYVVGIARRGERYFVFGVTPNRSIVAEERVQFDPERRVFVVASRTDEWAKDLERDGTPDIFKSYEIPVADCEESIEPILATGIFNVWEQMLRRVSSDDQLVLGFDGTSYHFSMDSGEETLAGQTWSPEPSTRAGRLAKLVDLMAGYCKSGDRDHTSGVILDSVNGLLKDLR